jgi:hypothetical protein
VQQVGPNSSPIQYLPSAVRVIDSTSKSAPVSTRSGRVSANGSLPYGSVRLIPPSTSTAPLPNSGATGWMRSRKSALLALLP